MSQRGLEALLRPQSIAVIGASGKAQPGGFPDDEQSAQRRFCRTGSAGHAVTPLSARGTGISVCRGSAAGAGSGHYLHPPQT